MNFSDEQIKKILLDQSYVSAEDMKNAEITVEKTHGSIVDYLFEHDILNKSLLGQAIAESLHSTYGDTGNYQPTREQVMQIPEEIARKFHLCFFNSNEKDVTVITDDPGQEGIKEALSPIFPGKQILIAYSNTDEIDNLYVRYRPLLQTRFVEIVKNQKSVAPEILNEIIKDTLYFHASDIHFEPQEKEVIIRFRIDGVLHEAGRIAKEQYENIVNRMKVQANLRIDEHQACQDGAIRINHNKRNLDLRISIAPTLDGEKVALRLMTEYAGKLSVSNLGLNHRNEDILIKAAHKPFGMILVTGPTGSGKTTTLYALVQILKRTEVNITTIEDPVEYKVPEINQIQVNPETNITFADGLRSIARQDPDIILVGEIRDEETAEIAVNAALTGHLLLSSFHANDAATAIPRLLDMGVEPFLVSSSLELIIAQRLVRKLCESCRYSYNENKEQFAANYPGLEKYFPQEDFSLYKAKGCSACNQTGYKGRTAIFEFIHISTEMQDLILKNPAVKQIWELARKQGATSLFEDGLEKVKSGVTSLEELLRIASPPTN